MTECCEAVLTSRDQEDESEEHTAKPPGAAQGRWWNHWPYPGQEESVTGRRPKVKGPRRGRTEHQGARHRDRRGLRGPFRSGGKPDKEQ